ncbi:hypothetical protein [Streptomyces sp. NPDC006739]|uniref:hypothetical protein n=1 Tax=Streptomyces sp. NPDC006739 TaxID=3364763 RepID=UPI00369163E9
MSAVAGHIRLRRKYPDVVVRHLDLANPATQGDFFCEGGHFAEVNGALTALGADRIDGLPSKGARAGDRRGPEPAARSGQGGRRPCARSAPGPTA